MRTSAHSTASARPRAILIAVQTPATDDLELEDSLRELGRLVKTLGLDVVGQITQKRANLAGGTVLGEGKLKDLARRTGGTGERRRKPVKKSKAALKREEPDLPELEPEDPEEEEELGELAEVVVFDGELSPSQLANLQAATGCEVLDRTGVIVEIFSRHARTREARLQVEIARLKYLAPRIRFAGGRGSERMNKAGESSLELDRRKIRDRISELHEEIATIQKEQSTGRDQRSLQNCVALVGYTNAGKSSLMRALTGSQVLVEDKLFATLDTTVRTLVPPTVPPILVSDTVGFIKKLPHDLVASFRSTLEEARNAGLLLFVVDSADPSFRTQLEVTREVLASLGVENVPSRLVLNKRDKLAPEQREALAREFPDALAISAKDPADVAALRDFLIVSFEAGKQESEVFVPYASQKAVGALRGQFRATGERHTDEGTWLRLVAGSEELRQATARLGLSGPPL